MSEEKTTISPDAPKIAFGFAILVTENGDVFVERTKEAFALDVARDASLLEVRRYASEVIMDLQAQSAAEYVTLRLAALNKVAESAEKDAPVA